MNKKADQNSIWIIVTIVLALVMAVGILYAATPIFKKSNEAQTKFTACEGVNGYCAAENCKEGETKMGENILGCPPKTNDKATLCCIRQGTEAKDLISLGYIEENGESWTYVNNGETITLSKTKKYLFSMKVESSAETKYCTLGLYNSKEVLITKVTTDDKTNLGCNNKIYLPKDNPPNPPMPSTVDPNTKFIVANTYSEINKEDLAYLVKKLKVNVVLTK